MKELTKPISPIANPLYIFGNNSESITHITGPREKAKQAINPIIPSKTKIELILIDNSNISPSLLENSFVPFFNFL